MISIINAKGNKLLNFIITYWIEFLFGILASFFVILGKELRKQMRMQQAIKEGVRVLLYEALYELYCDAHNEVNEKNGLAIETLNRATNIYKQYKTLGGNDAGDEIYAKIKEMPLKGGRD